MEAIEGYKLFQVTECEWYKARDMFEAIQTAMTNTGLPFDEACDIELHELSEAEIDILKYVDSDEGNPENPPVCTFRERLKYEMKEMKKEPGLFASTEY